MNKFKMVISLCEEIQQKSPEHAETIAFKALALNNTGEHQEANVIIKGALAKNLKNFTVWHIFGII